MNINLLTIPLSTTNNSSNNNKLILSNEVPNTALILAVAGSSDEVEFQRGGELHEHEDEAEDGPHCEL